MPNVQINMLAEQKFDAGSLGVLTSAGNPWTVPDAMAIQLVDRGFADPMGWPVALKTQISDDVQTTGEAFAVRTLQPLASSVASLMAEYGEAGEPGFAPSYTWATLPAASAYIGVAYISDIGARGSLWRSDGSVWGVVGGSVVLESSAVAKAAHTGSTTETLIHTYAIPAGLLGLNGELEFNGKVSQTAGAAGTARLRLGGIGGSQLLNLGTGTSLSVPIRVTLQNRGVANSQLASNGSVSGLVANGNAWSTVAVDTAVAQDLVFSWQLAATGDSATLQSWQIILRRP